MDAPAERLRVNKQSRKPFGSHLQKLAYPPREGYHRHWFNDSPGRLETALEAGYTHVIDKEGRKVARPVGINDSGSALMGYLMEIPLEWYKEDMEAQQRPLDQFDDSLRRGEDSQGKPGQDGRYIPARGITIKDGK